MNIKKLLLNSSFLSIIKIFTMAIGLVQSMVLAHLLTTEDFALYSQSSVIIATIGGITAFGFADSIIYFSGISKEEDEKKTYLSVIFIFQTILCVIFGIIMFFMSNLIGKLFNNEALSGLVYLICFFPFLVNTSNCLNQLLFTERKIKSIGIGNLFFSALSLAIVILVVNNSSPVFLYLILEISLYVIYIIYQVFCYLIEKKRFIHFSRLNKEYIKKVLSYAIPLGVAIIGATLLKELDKIIISNQCSTQDYATYSAVSRQLPITFFAAALSAQILPLLAVNIEMKNHSGIIKNLHIYYIVGFVSTLILGLGVLTVSRQSLEILYSEKYINGIWVYIIYIFVDIVGFAYPGMLLTVSGRSKELLIHAMIMLGVNIALNFLFLYWFGMIGPALSTLIVQIGGLIVQTYRGLKVNNLRVIDSIPFLKIFLCVVFCMPSMILFTILSYYFPVNNILDVFIYGVPCIVCNSIVCYIYLRKKLTKNSMDETEEIEQ